MIGCQICGGNAIVSSDEVRCERFGCPMNENRLSLRSWPIVMRKVQKLKKQLEFEKKLSKFSGGCIGCHHGWIGEQ